MTQFTFASPIKGRSAILLENYFNKYRFDPVYNKLSLVAETFAQACDYKWTEPSFNEAYHLGGGGRAEDLKTDLLKETMPDTTYKTILTNSVDKLVELLANKQILTSNELTKLTQLQKLN